MTQDYFRSVNYNIYRIDRPRVDGGGGVALMVHNSLHSEFVTNNMLSRIECVTVKIKYGARYLIAACIYRPPNSSPEYNDAMNDVITELSNFACDQTIICGDFNFPNIDWINLLFTDDSVEQSFYDGCQDSFLHQHVTEFTRQRGTNLPSLLDLILTKNELEIELISYLAPIGKSDHAVLAFDFALEGYVEIEDFVFPKKRFFKGDYDKSITLFQTTDWQLISNMDIDSKWNYILDKYNYVVDLCIPVGFGTQNTNERWMTRETARARNKKIEMWDEHRKKRTPASFASYCHFRNVSVSTIREAQMKYEEGLSEDIKKGDTKVFYSYLRSKTTIKESVTSVRKPDGTLSESTKETADTINFTFQSVFVKEDGGPLPHINYVFNGTPLTDIDFSVSDVYEVLCKLKESSAPGPDGMHPKVLKECAKELSLPLYLLFRSSLDEGKIPECWKTAHVSPIYKKGSKQDPLNYRPISLTSIACKILERIIRNKIMDHLEANNILTKMQHGFRSNRSCLTHLLEYFLEIHDAFDNSDPVDVIYMDCKKAFDTVPHRRLLAKLEAYGIRGNLLKWMEAFLTGRSQRVVIKGVLSESLPVWSGVPQGSVLGPLLFLIFINDLLDEVDSSGSLFADDSKLFRKINCPHDQLTLQNDLAKLQDWSRKWLLEFNEKKCKVMHIGRLNLKLDYHINNTVLVETKEEKDLGVYITPDLKSATHVAKVAAKANSMIGRIRHTFKFMNTNIFKSIYPGLVRSHMEYAVQVWSPHLKKDIKTLEKVQRRAFNIVPELRGLTYEQQLTELGLTTLEERRRRGDLIEVFKIMHGYENLDRSYFFVLESEVHGYATRRHGLSIKTPTTVTKRRKKFFDIRIINDWNRLPASVVYSRSIGSFKRALDDYYSVQEATSN